MAAMSCMVPEIWSGRDKFLSFWIVFWRYCEDIIFLHMCTINDNHMMYGSWDMEYDRQKFLSFRTFFWPFMPLTTWKIKILKKMKKTPGDIIILHKCTVNDNRMSHGPWDMKHDTQFFIILHCFLPFYPP